MAMQSGAPFTPRVVGSFLDVGSGVNGTLRADYNGSDISIGDPTTLRFFNTDAFSIPAAGAVRDGVAQPDHRSRLAQHEHEPVEERQLQPQRAASRSALQANNVFNTVQFSSIDTVVNSPTFGQVTSVRPMRSVQVQLAVQVLKAGVAAKAEGHGDGMTMSRSSSVTSCGRRR